MKNGSDSYHLNNDGDAPIFSIYDRDGNYSALIEAGIDINHAYGKDKITLAHHIFKKIDDNIESYNRSSGPIYSTGNTNLDALFLFSKSLEQYRSRIEIFKGITNIVKIKKLKADFTVKDSSGNTPMDIMDGFISKKYIEELIHHHPLQSPPADYGIVLTMLITNLAPGNLDLNEAQRKTNDPFLKQKIEECKSLPKGKYTLEDIQRKVNQMLN